MTQSLLLVFPNHGSHLCSQVKAVPGKEENGQHVVQRSQF